MKKLTQKEINQIQSKFDKLDKASSKAIDILIIVSFIYFAGVFYFS